MILCLSFVSVCMYVRDLNISLSYILGQFEFSAAPAENLANKIESLGELGEEIVFVNSKW